MTAPRGKGLYARADLLNGAQLVAYLRAGKYDWVAVQPAHLRRGAGGALKAAGIPFWIFSTPNGDGDPQTADSWLPSAYRATIAEFERLALAHGAKGYIADTESGWAQASAARRAELAAELVASAKRSGLSVGLTTFYTHPVWRSVGPAAGRDVWLSLQMYNDRTAAQNAHILEEAKAAGWTVHVPSVGAYRHADDDQDGDFSARARTVAEWKSAYDDFPQVRGAVIWYALPAPTGTLAAAIAAWRRWTPPFLVTIAWVAAATAAAGAALFIAVHLRRGSG